MRKLYFGMLAGLALLCGACGDEADPSDSNSTSGDSQNPVEVHDHLADVSGGSVSGATTAGAPGAVVVYGGLRVDREGGSYEVVDRGVLVDDGGVRSTFTAGARLVDVDLTLFGDRIVVAGRSCEGVATIGDVGVSCTPGTAMVRVVDLPTGETSHLPLPEERSDVDGDELFVETHDVGGQLVVRVTHPGGTDVLLAAEDLSTLETVSEGTRPGPACATEDVLVERSAGHGADRELPSDPNDWGDLEREPIVLRFLDLESRAWYESPPSPTVAPGPQHLVCTADRAVVVVAEPEGPVKVLVHDHETTTWSESELPAVGGMATAVAGSIADQVLVTDPSGGAARFTPLTSAVRPTEVPQGSGGASPIVSVGGDRFAILVGGDTPSLELIP